jgi:hypothetical protein
MRQRFNELADPDQRVVSLKPLANSKGNVLLSYFPDFFLALPGQALPTNTHAAVVDNNIFPMARNRISSARIRKNSTNRRIFGLVWAYKMARLVALFQSVCRATSDSDIESRTSTALRLGSSWSYHYGGISSAGS